MSETITAHELSAKLRALDDETLCFTDQTPLFTAAADLIEAQDCDLRLLRVMADEPTTKRVWDGIRAMGALFSDPNHMPTVLEFKRAFDAAFVLNGEPYDVERIKHEWQADYKAMEARATKAEADLAAVTAELDAVLVRALKAEAAIAALDGWKLVPITPTQDMLMAGVDRPQPDPFDPQDHEWGGMYRAIYGAMLAASPPAERVVTALAQIDRALGRDNAAANPLRRIDYPEGRFGPAMLEGDDEMNIREMKLIAKSHGFELRVAVEEWGTEAAEVLNRNGTFGEALEVEDVPQSIVGGYQLVGAWDEEEGGLALVYARPLAAEGTAAPGASS